MRRTGLLVLIVGMLLLLVGIPQAAAVRSIEAVRLVSTGGIDSGDCLGSPCRTISYAVSQALPGDTVSVAAGSYAGGVLLNKDALQVVGGVGTIVGPGSPAFTVAADDVEITGLTIDGAGSADPGLLVLAGASNLMLHDCQITGWADGIELAGSVTSFKVVSNWIHDNADAGLQVDAGVTIGGVVTVEGNLFKANGGNGIQNNSATVLEAEYNSWGHLGGPSAGDGISANVDAAPFTFIELFMDVDPENEAGVRYVADGQVLDVKLKADAAKVYGVTFKLTYDPALLTLNSTTFAAPWAGRCFPIGSPPAGTLLYRCNLFSPTPEWDADGGTIATLNFTAHAGAGSGPWTSFFDISHLPADTSAGAVGGVKVWVNNAGYGAPSLPARDISDTDDGQVIILGETTVTLDSTPAAIQGCEEVEVAVWVDNVLGLYGADIELTFDPAVLEVVDFDPGTPGVQLEIVYGFFNPGWILFNTADNTAGTIHFVGVQLNPTPPANGSGALVIIHFRARSVSASSPLHFTRTDMSTRDGFMIPNTPVDGTASTEAPDGAALSLSIARLNATTARLSWTAVAGADHYHLYRSTLPYFTPAEPPYQSVSGLSYDDVGALGSTTDDYFYVARAACANGFMSTDSSRMGEFDFDLLETARTDYSWIAIPLNVTGLSMASDLANHIQNNSTVAVTVLTISRWNATAQAFDIYYHQFSFGNFPVIGQSVYRVEVDVQSGVSSVWTQVGGVPTIGSYNYTLQETARTDYNWIMVPLDKGAATLASLLANDIQANSSGAVTVSTVSRWNRPAQGYDIYYHQFAFGDFPTRIGYPYRVEVDVASGSSVVWPIAR